MVTIMDIQSKKDLKLKDVHVIVKEFGSVPSREKVKYVKVIGKVGKTVVGREKEQE